MNWSVLKLLNSAVQYLEKKNVDSPRSSSEILLARTLHCKRVDLYVRYQEVVSDEHRALYRTLIERRGNGEPIAYITRVKEFWSLEFEVGPGVFIPRPETEFIIECVKKIYNGNSFRCFEIG